MQLRLCLKCLPSYRARCPQKKRKEMFQILSSNVPRHTSTGTMLDIQYSLVKLTDPPQFPRLHIPKFTYIHARRQRSVRDSKDDSTSPPTRIHPPSQHTLEPMVHRFDLCLLFYFQVIPDGAEQKYGMCRVRKKFRKNISFFRFGNKL